MKTLLKRELLASVAAVQVMFSFGAVLGYTAYLVPELRDGQLIHFIIDQHSLSIIAISGAFLLPIGTLLNIYTIEKLGRKGTMLVSMIISSVGWIITAFAENVVTLVLGRSISSLMAGFSIASDIYISEVCSSKHRGTFAAFFSPLIALGEASIYILVYLFHWRISAMVMAACSVAGSLLISAIPESKHWYVTKNRTEEAKASIKWFVQCSDEEIEKELNDIVNSIPLQVSFSEKCKTFLKPLMLKRFAALSFLHIFTQWTGATIIISFAVDIFALLKTPYNEKTLALICGFLVFLGSVILTSIIHTRDRRTFLIISAGAMFVCVSFVLIFRLSGLGTPAISAIGLLLYVTCYGLGVSDVVWIIVPELFPTLIRGTAVSAICFLSLVNMPISIYLYGPIVENLGFDGLCSIFAISAGTVVIITYFFIPETRNIPLHLISAERNF